MTARFWVCAILGIIASLAAAILRERQQRRRKRHLEAAVRVRTVELECERSRQKNRNQILEMMLANHSLGDVLDHVANLVTADAPGTICAILLRHDARIHVAAAPGASAFLLEALQTPHAVPFEVWKGAADFLRPSTIPRGRSLCPG